MRNNRTKIMTTGALMVALATILSFIQFSGAWLAGGSITLFSMVPICLFAYLYGVKWGFLCGGVHGIIQCLLGLNALKGITFTTFVGAILLDYILAFALLGFAGIFRKIVKNRPLGFALGCVFAGLLRFICHFLSGFLLWGSLTQDGLGAVVFSFTYNMSFMGPEILITALGGFVVMSTLKNTEILKLGVDN